MRWALPSRRGRQSRVRRRALTATSRASAPMSTGSRRGGLGRAYRSRSAGGCLPSIEPPNRTSRCGIGSGPGSIRAARRRGSGCRRALKRLDHEAALQLLEIHAGPELELVPRSRARRQGREVARLEPVAVREQHRPFDDVTELAHVARPAVLLQDCEAAGVAPSTRLRNSVEPIDEVLDEQRDILRVRPERRDRDRQDVQPVEQVGPEARLCDFRVEVAVGRGDDPDIDRMSADPPTRLNALSSRNRSSLAWSAASSRRSRRERPCRRPRSRGGPSLKPCVGERTALVAEQLALEQMLGKG